MLHYAYSRQVPVQIVITANKEAVISEKDMSAHFGQTLVVGYSEVIKPQACQQPQTRSVTFRMPRCQLCSSVQHGLRPRGLGWAQSHWYLPHGGAPTLL